MDKKKKKKDKVVYYDDNSTVVDMSAVNKSGQKDSAPQPRQRSSFKEKWKTYWSAVGMMLLPLIIVLSVIFVLYLIVLFLI